MSENGKYRSGGEKAYPGLRGAAIAMALAMGFSLLPAGETELSAAEEESKIRTYTFAEVTAIAKNNGSEVEQQKANVESAETRKEDQLSSYQTASYEYWYNGGTGDDSSLDSMEESYQSAVNNYNDAEEKLEDVQEQSAYKAQQLYIGIIMGREEIEYQKLEIAQLEKDYKVAQARYSFGSITKSELESARQAVEKGRTTLNGLEDTLEENMDDMRDYLDLNEGVEFDLRDPPELGQYAVDFDEEEVLEGLTKNSLSLKQAQRNVDELNEKVQKYRDQGKTSKADELADTGTSYDLALKEAKKSITSSVNSAFKNYRDLQTAMEDAEAADEQANSDLLVTQLKFRMGTATQKELTAAELTYAQAEQSLRQAEYDLYFGARRLALLSSGVTV